ncbi:hypothetical protein AMTRI_Chr08g204700 [Amborella trichopoda]
MDSASASSREQEEPLLLSIDQSHEISLQSPRNHAKDVHILSSYFLLIFLAYGATQNLESTVNTVRGRLGTTSMGILYLSLTIFSLVASPVVQKLGSKNSLVLGTTGYWFFIAENLIPSWYTLVPASVYLGFAASIIWVGQVTSHPYMPLTYLTASARSHARQCCLHEGTVIGNFNGELWGMCASTHVFGNLILLALLRNGKEGTYFMGKTLLFVVFLGSMTLGTILMCFLGKKDTIGESSIKYTSFGELMKLIVSPMIDKRMLLLIPLLAYSGLQQAFVWAEFTKYVVTPALGISGVRGSMAIYSTTDAILKSIAWEIKNHSNLLLFILHLHDFLTCYCDLQEVTEWSVVVGCFTFGLNSISLIVSGGAFLQILVLLWLLLKYRGLFNTQVNATLGILFRDNTEAAFAQLKVWQSAATAVIFFLSPYVTFHAVLALMIVALCISVASFLFFSVKVEKAFAHAPSH